jgi:hypothetical protein
MIKFFKNLFSKSDSELKSEYSVTINPKDFEGTEYVDGRNCALATAMKRDSRFKGREIIVGGAGLSIDNEIYNFVSMNGIPYTTQEDLIVSAYRRIEKNDALTLEPIVVKFQKA